jgi:serine/threonine protein kinase
MPPSTLSGTVSLVGTPIDGGWTIIEEMPRPGASGAEDLTGGCFSVGCIVERTRGKKTERAFLKVIDVNLAAATFPGDIMRGLKIATDSYTIEHTILDICKSARLDRIIRVLAIGQLPAVAGALPAPYILFEKADGDLRKLVGRSNSFDTAWKLKVLHDIAVGLQQLHQQKIAHQDLKPSNVLIFNDDGQGAKIGDLGRSSFQGLTAPHDGYVVAGATAYAPPEQVFGITPARWEDRREGCDIYHLGTVAFFLFAGQVPNEYYRTSLAPEVLPVAWGGLGKTNYALALPFFTASLTQFIAKIGADFPEWGRDEMSQILFNACEPDYEKRGDPDARKRVGSPLGIETFVSRFDRLSRRALVHLKP